MSNRRALADRAWIAVIAMAFAFSALAGWVLHHETVQRLKEEQAVTVSVLRDRIDRETEHIAVAAATAARLLESFPSIDQATFAEILTATLEADGTSGIRAVALTAPTAGTDIADRLAMAYPDAERFPGGSLEVMPPGERAIGYPAFRVAPEAGNAAVAGFDLWANDARRAAAQAAFETGRLTASDPVELSQDTEAEVALSSWLLVRPYTLPDGVAWGQGPGLVAIGYTLQASTLLPPAASTVRLTDLGIETAIGETQAGETTILLDRLESDCRFCAESAETITFLNRTWSVRLQNRYWEAGFPMVSAFVGVPFSLFVATLGIGGWGIGAHRRRRDLQRRVAEQTAALSAANAEIGAALKRAQEAVTSQRVFLQTMSHELRTPLNAILGTAEMMIDPDLRRLLSIEDGEAWTRVQLAGNRLFAMTEALLFISDLDRGAVTPTVEPVPLDTVLGDAWNRTRRLQEEERPPFRVGGDSAAVVRTDPDLLARALTCLLDNAYKAGAPVELEIETDADRVAVTVIDNGPGLTAAVEANLFQRFVGKRGLDVRGRSGLGLGLATVAEISSLLAVEVSIRNKAEGGVQATLAIPRESDAGPTETSPRPARAPA